MARRLSQRHGKPCARLDTASTRSSFFSSSASFLCHRFFLHRPAWQFFLFVFRFSCCHRPVWQFSRFVFRFTCCHRPVWQFSRFVFRFTCCHRPLWQFSRFVFRCHGGKPPPARLLAYANTPLPPLRALNRRARNARALPILSHCALRSAPYLVCSLFPQMNNTTRKLSIIAHCSRPPRLC